MRTIPCSVCASSSGNAAASARCWRFQSNDNRLPPASTAIRITATTISRMMRARRSLTHALHEFDSMLVSCPASLCAMSRLVSRDGCADTAANGGHHGIQSARDRPRRHASGRRKNPTRQRRGRPRGARCRLQNHHRYRALASDGAAGRERTRHQRTVDCVFWRAGASAGGRSRHFRRTFAGGFRRAALSHLRRGAMCRDGHGSRSCAAETRRRTGSRADDAGDELGAAAAGRGRFVAARRRDSGRPRERAHPRGTRTRVSATVCIFSIRSGPPARSF